jgi:hypothetical protein
VSQTDPERRAEHSAVALQAAQVDVTLEQMGAASGHVAEEEQVVQAPVERSHESSLLEMAQHCDCAVQATQTSPAPQMGVEPEHAGKQSALVRAKMHETMKKEMMKDRDMVPRGETEV